MTSFCRDAVRAPIRILDKLLDEQPQYEDHRDADQYDQPIEWTHYEPSHAKDSASIGASWWAPSSVNPSSRVERSLVAPVLYQRDHLSVGWLPDSSARQIHCLLDVPTCKLMITMLAAIAEFERGSAGAPAGSFMLEAEGQDIARAPGLARACHHASSVVASRFAV